MSDSSTNEARNGVTSGLSDAIQNRILRFTIGVALATFLAAWIDWPLAFVAPIFTAKFLFEKRVLHIDIVYELLLAMIVTVAIGVALSVGFAQYPIPMLLSVAALMLVGYYLFPNPKWNLFATILLMSTLMLPFMAIQSTGTTIFLAVGLSLSGAISVAIFALMHVYLPEREETYQSHKAVELSDSFRWFSAVRALIIAFPVVCVFFVLQISEALLSMIFIALLSLMITGEKSVKLSVFLLLSNAIGGVIAIIVFGFLAWCQTSVSTRFSLRCWRFFSGKKCTLNQPKHLSMPRLSILLWC